MIHGTIQILKVKIFLIFLKLACICNNSLWLMVYFRLSSLLYFFSYYQWITDIINFIFIACSDAFSFILQQFVLLQSHHKLWKLRPFRLYFICPVGQRKMSSVLRILSRYNLLIIITLKQALNGQIFSLSGYVVLFNFVLILTVSSMIPDSSGNTNTSGSNNNDRCRDQSTYVLAIKPLLFQCLKPTGFLCIIFLLWRHVHCIYSDRCL